MNINEVKKVLNQRMPQANNMLNAVITKSENSYGLYGLYQIFKENDQFITKRLSDDYSKTFGNLRAATAWCILDKQHKVYLANTLYELDMKIAGIMVELSQATIMKDKGATLNEYIQYDSKYNILLDKKVSMVAQINKIINEASIWQERQFLRR